MVVGYLVIMTTLGFGLRRLYRSRAGEGQAPGQAAGPRAPAGVRAPAGPRAPAGVWQRWRGLARHVLGTVVGGYLLLMAVVIAYYYGVARVGGNFIESAFTGTALLIGVTMPVFAAASWLTQRQRPRDRDTAGEDPARSP